MKCQNPDATSAAVENVFVVKGGPDHVVLVCDVQTKEKASRRAVAWAPPS